MRIKILLIIVITALIANYNLQSGKDGVKEAFLEIQYDEVNSLVEGFGEYTGEYLTIGEEKELIENVASILQMDTSTGNYEKSNTNERRETIFTKETKNCDITIKFITYEEKGSNNVILSKQYFYVLLDFKNSTTYTPTYKQVVENMFEKIGISGKVYMHYNGYTKGDTSESIRGNIKNVILQSMDAKLVSEYSKDGTTVVYAYSNRAGDSILIDNKEINVSLVITYIENEDKTLYTLSTPLNNNDF